ncbi:hypothetical protein PoB_005161100 [Plakobranchus ocellatus]|uniref:Uncharacterized protein n=1 Tax=Plakobranchus ocellatus TaxID=259542 RepID=A0AAV4BPD6_9GAST|nr:hypothetical protein PoB_005161100 [Plakobranchus ocellatus]
MLAANDFIPPGVLLKVNGLDPPEFFAGQVGHWTNYPKSCSPSSMHRTANLLILLLRGSYSTTNMFGVVTNVMFLLKEPCTVTCTLHACETRGGGYGGAF